MRHARLVVLATLLGTVLHAAVAMSAEPPKEHSSGRSESPSVFLLLTGGFGGAVVALLASLVTTLANNRHQARLEAARTEAAARAETTRITAAKELEALKAEVDTRAKAAEKRATVAADALLACLELFEGMEAVASVTRIVGDPEDQPDEDTRERYRRKAAARWEWLKKYDTQFDQAYKMAQVYLPDAACGALARLRKLQWSIHVDQMTHAELVAFEHRPDTEKFFEGGYGKVPTEQINALRDELKSLLRPIVQFAPKTP